MLAYATRLLGDRASAEDVVQEALIRAWRNPDVLTNGKGSTRGWLLTVVRNLVIDRARARAARPAEVADDPDPQPSGITPIWSPPRSRSRRHCGTFRRNIGLCCSSSTWKDAA